TDETMLGSDITDLLCAGDEAMSRGNVDDAPPTPLLHAGQRRFGGVERGREIDRDDRIPFVGGEFLDRRDVLDAGIVDEDVAGAEITLRGSDHRSDLHRLRYICAGIRDF